MPRHGSKPYIDSSFQISPLAAALSVVAGGLLALGIFRAELASLLWGGTFLVLALFAFLATLLQRGLLVGRTGSGRGSGELGAIEAVPDPRWTTVGGPVSLTLSGRLDIPRIPGVRLLYASRLRWRDVRTLYLSAPVTSSGGGPSAGAASSDGARHSGGIEHPARGAYRPAGARLVITDALGFFRFSLRAPEPLGLTVVPEVRGSQLTSMVSHREGDEPERSDRRIRTEELLEVRRYVPGDDVRRINWKQYARWEELFLRIGEEVPPVSQEVTLLLRATPSLKQLLPEEFALGALDRAVGLLGDLAAGFALQGLSVRYALEEDKPRLLEAPDSIDFLRDLADASWSSGRAGRTLLRGSRCIVVALPDPGLGSYLAEIGRWAGSLAVVLSEAPASSGERQRLKWLLRSRDIKAGGRWEGQARKRYMTLVESAIVGSDGKVSEFHRV